jgi:nucleotide-binding universal stress UspA family protein
MNLMVCFDGSDVSYHALRIAKKRASRLGAEIFLVTSMVSSKDVATQDYDKAEKLLKKAKSRLAEEAIPCETLLSVKSLTAGENLSRIAKEKSIDEVYIGVKRRSKVGKLVFGSTAQYVILNASCPVVTVK